MMGEAVLLDDRRYGHWRDHGVADDAAIVANIGGHRSPLASPWSVPRETEITGSLSLLSKN